MHILLPDGRRFDGAALTILRQMKSIAFFVEGMSLSEYIDWVARNVGELHGLAVEPRGSTDEERATSLLEQLVDGGMAVDLSKESL